MHIAMVSRRDFFQKESLTDFKLLNGSLSMLKMNYTPLIANLHHADFFHSFSKRMLVETGDAET